MAMELIQFIGQDFEHFVGAVILLWVVFLGVQGCITAWRSK